MDTQLENVMQRTQRYFYEDGLVEITVGVLFLAIGGLILAFAVSQPAAPLVIIASLVAPLAIFGMARLLKLAVGRAKEELTYPRTGYLSYRKARPARDRWIVVAFSLGLAALILFLPESFSQMAAVEGALILIIFTTLGYRLGLRRFYLIGLLGLLAGAGAAYLLGDDTLGTAATFAGTGMALLASGAFVLIRYLQRNPKPEVDEK
jgi:hypothetical protein